MRINVYSQELITDGEKPEGFVVEGIQEQSNTGVVYSAVRLYLHSSERLHHPPADDDRSAITFWLPKSKERREQLARDFQMMAALVREAPAETGLD